MSAWGKDVSVSWWLPEANSMADIPQICLKMI